MDIVSATVAKSAINGSLTAVAATVLGCKVVIKDEAMTTGL